MTNVAPLCLDEPLGDCAGEVQYHSTDPGVTRAFPRCEKHWAARLDKEDEWRRRYPVQQPADFDPAYAGERWNEDD